MFCNTLTANEKYPFQDLENLFSSTQLQLSLKPKTFSHFCNRFLESSSNFKHFEKKKMIVIATVLQNSQAVKDLIRLLPKKHCFRTLFDSQHVKGSQTLLKSE